MLAALYGRQMTTAQLAAALPDVPPATLYRHVARLAAAGILTVVERRPVRGTLEKVYAAAEGAGSLGPEAVGRMSRPEWEGAFRAFTASLLGQFGAYIGQKRADPVADGVGFRTAPLYLTDAELAQLAAELSAVVRPALANGPAPGRRRRLLSTVLIPDLADPDAAENGED